jgi:four helix bundle protein
MELETHMFIAQRLNYLGANDVEHILSLSGELSRMLTGLTKKLSARRTNT